MVSSMKNWLKSMKSKTSMKLALKCQQISSSKIRKLDSLISSSSLGLFLFLICNNILTTSIQYPSNLSSLICSGLYKHIFIVFGAWIRKQVFDFSGACPNPHPAELVRCPIADCGCFQRCSRGKDPVQWLKVNPIIILLGSMKRGKRVSSLCWIQSNYSNS